ncbi:MULTISPECIES: hypothetical protein [Shewanella]|uniref:hypothetical protein n=1 Tax=Shewanella TaxID=22 RepID=UPI0005A110AD|nr:MULTISPECIES: hypothetical protein [Shewanella]KIO35108.1 hypothetical protein DB48_17715 [Shewanella sp. cp20]MCG9723252.1 hypothetical protein [Shewanella sp. Isolate7]MCG9746268.1 hypothetical protein [Shewanella sp. Isolate8]MCL2912035.1 hypothetical protein [Shewanella aquimarina]
MRKTLTLSLLALMANSAAAAPSEAELAFNKEVLECAAYYQIASETIAGMNAPQMKPVGERLKQSGQDAVTLAKKYQDADKVEQQLAATIADQRASLPSNNNLGSLMGRYKGPCQKLMANPQQRLDYWIMATM